MYAHPYTPLGFLAAVSLSPFFFYILLYLDLSFEPRTLRAWSIWIYLHHLLETYLLRLGVFDVDDAFDGYVESRATRKWRRVMIGTASHDRSS